MEPTVTRKSKAAPQHVPLIQIEGNLAYFNGRIVPMNEANVSVATHAIHYGTGCYDGIRGYWNAEQGKLYLLKLREHYARFAQSCKMLRIAINESVDDLCAITLDLLRRQNFQRDVYIRPVAFKSSPTFNLNLSQLESTIAIYATPLGDYHDISHGLHVAVSSWRRVSGAAIPLRAKTTGGYINCCLATDEAIAAGYDEAVFLTEQGHVSEGSACNIFLVKGGQLHTPRAADDILEGITRAGIIELAERELHMPTQIRAIDRSELYDADEVFFSGTGVQIVPVTQVERRPVGAGEPGPVTLDLQRRYFAIARGNDPAYAAWVTAV